MSDNHSGTTSLQHWFSLLGFSVGNQQVAADMWKGEAGGHVSASSRQWHRYIRRSEVFQDTPFSWPHFLPWLLWNYPRAFYIHVSRRDAEWYQSMVKHHLTHWLNIELEFDGDGSVIWSDSLRELADSKQYRGAPLYQSVSKRFGTSMEDPYNREILIANHRFQNSQARHLLGKKRSLLLDCDALSEEVTSRRIENFLDMPATEIKIPQSNRHL
ncbi:hypothetical protein N8797_01085 [Pontimonas sp.]|nr:hypothetical protein [Pontimonas sp.]